MLTVRSATTLNFSHVFFKFRQYINI